MYLALADGAAGFIQDFTGPVLLRIPLPPRPLRLPAFHRLWGCFPGSFDSLQVQMLWSYYLLAGCPARIWAGSRSLATTWDITIVFFSSSYLDVSVRRVRLPCGISRLLGMGFPIRIPADQRFFAAPRRFSQLSTSFIATVCLGIHRVPFSTFPCMACTTPGRAARFQSNELDFLPRSNKIGMCVRNIITHTYTAFTTNMSKNFQSTWST